MEKTMLREPAAANWHKALAAAIRDPDELCDVLRLPDRIREPARRAARQFPLLVPRGFVARMKPGDPDDPLLRQVLPIGAEEESVPGYSIDPLAERASAATPGMLQKYPGRALLVMTGACAVHCRYCFRRHFPYDESPRKLSDWAEALAHLEADETIHEVLLSGGDPLTRTDAWLAEFARRLAAIKHVRRLRLHTRLPIVLPERVNDELLSWLTGTRLAPFVVVHCNHPAELDGPTRRALARLVDAGVPVLNQAVLLRGVNDDADTLAELCERLVDLRVLPYYLHQLDRVSGAAQFEVGDEPAKKLVADLARRLPGYAVPRLVREIPGESSKTAVR